jgi:hypothetical protein
MAEHYEPSYNGFGSPHLLPSCVDLFSDAALAQPLLCWLVIMATHTGET